MSDVGTLLGRLRQAGSLSAPQLDFLRQRGFLPAVPQDRDQDSPNDDWYDYDPPLETDADDETEQIGSERRRRNSRRRGTSGPDLKATMLADQLATLYGERIGVLQAVVPLAELGEGERTPVAAMRWLRRRVPTELAGPLRDRLSDRTVTVEGLWNVLTLQDFDRIGSGSPGPAPIAYRALVSAARNGQDDPPVKYAWLLREESVAAVYDLLVTQRRLIESAGLVHRLEPVLLREGLRRRPQRLAFWTLLLLFNIDLDANRVGKGSGQLQTVPTRPDDATWTQAWAHALLMNESEVLPFLAGLHEKRTTAEGEPVEVPLYCPEAWNRMMYRYSG